MLTSARDEYRRQQYLTALGVREARRRASGGPREVARVVATYQLAAVALALEAVPAQLDEQGVDAPAEGRVNPSALLTGPATVGMVDKATSAYAVDRLVSTLITDANRAAKSVDMGRRLAVTGHVRYLNPPSCGRCAVLAGRVYRWSTGFQRHPGCDCLMVPTTEAVGAQYVSDPMVAFERGQVRGLSKADAEAIRDGADMGRVVNVRRKQAGLTMGSSVVERGGRMTPAGIYRVASDKAEALTLLRRFGYVL